MINHRQKTFIFKLIICMVIIFADVKKASSQKLNVDTSINHHKALKFKSKALIMPTLLLSYGLIGIESDALKIFNAEIKEEVQ